MTARFFSALATHRGDGACATLSAPLRKAVMQDESERRCAAAVLKLKSRGGPVRAVRVYATSARVDLADGESVFLGATREGWRIQALGCRPAPSGPGDCEIQA